MNARILLFGLGLMVVRVVEGASAPVLVPANIQPQTDSQGFIWDVESSSGSISNGSNCFSNALYLEVNGSSVSFQQAQMTADGSEYYFSGQVNNLTVTRRVRVETKGAFVRYFDSVTNNGPAQNMRLCLRVNFNNQMQAVVTDSGVATMNAFGPKDTGIAVLRPAGQQGPSAILLLAGRNTKVRPTVQNQGNSQIRVLYNFPMAAGETVSIAHAVAQRTLNTVPDAKALAKLFAPLQSARLLADVSPRERKTLVNFSASKLSSGPAAPASVSFLEKLNVERGSSDVLAIGATTRLKGAASCALLEIETRRGKTTVPFEQVAAIIGGRSEARVLLRDGQALSGRLSTKGLKFTLTTGTTIQLEAALLDRLVLRIIPGEAQMAAAAWGFVETFDGDRLAVKADPALRLRASTAWGVREILPEDLVGCGPTEENPLGFRMALKDGSSFIAFLDGEEIGFQTVLFGRKAFRTSEIREIAVTQPAVAEDGVAATQLQAQVTVAGAQVFSGQIDLAELHFLSPAGVIPVAANLIRNLHNASEDGSESAPVFTAAIWGGSTVTGGLRELIVPVRSGGAVFQVPVRDLLDASVPSPAMPEGLRDKVAGLIRELAHPDWEKREASSRELSDLGAVARGQLEEVLKLTNDAEVRRRAQSLLDSMETF